MHVPYPLPPPQSCHTDHGLQVLFICMGIFPVIFLLFFAFFIYYKRFMSADLRERIRLLGSSTPNN